MRQRVIRLTLLLGVLLVMLSSVCFADQDLRFVDSREDTGYYVDVNSIAKEKDDQVVADIAVIKPDRNRMFMYRARFDRKKSTYQILKSEVLCYDTKKRLNVSEEVLEPLAYGEDSPMHSLVDYIYAVRDGVQPADLE